MIKKIYSPWLFLLIIVLIPSGCQLRKPTSITPTTMAITSTIQADSTIVKKYLPFKEKLDSSLNQIIGYSNVDLTKGDPESPLGNFFCDAILFYVKNHFKDSLYHLPTMVLLNNGGFRTELRKGPITVGDIFRLMPFDNTITILQLKGIDMWKLFNFIAQKGGMPIGGARLLFDAKTCIQAEIDNNSVDENKYYNVVTFNYLANGGDNISVFKDAIKRIDLPILLRDACIDYIKLLTENKLTIEAKKDGRIKYKGFDE